MIFMLPIITRYYEAFVVVDNNGVTKQLFKLTVSRQNVNFIHRSLE